MKRILLIFAVLCMMVCAGGCAGTGGGKTGSGEGSTARDSVAAEAEKSTEDARGDDSGKGAQDQTAAEPARPVLELGSFYYIERDEKKKDKYGNAKELLTASHDSIRLSDDSSKQYPELSASLARIMDKEKKEVKDQIAGQVEYLKDDPDLLEVEEAGLPYKTEGRLYVRRADRRVLSILENSFGYTGGAHGYSGYTAFNLDAATGKEISLGDIIADRDRLAEVLKTGLKEKYEDRIFFDEMPKTIDEEVKEKGESDLTWTLDPQGVTFYFNPYEIAPYAAGQLSMTILYNEEEGLFTDGYRPEEGEGYICGLPMYTGIDMDVDQDGKADNIYIYYNQAEEYDSIEKMTAVVNNRELSISDLYCYSIEAKTLMTADGRVFLYAWCTGDNDYVTLYMFDLSSGTPVLVDTGEMSEIHSYTDDQDEDIMVWKVVLTDPANMPLATGFNLLSTYSAFKTYSIGDDSRPESSDPFYTIQGEISLESVKEIEAVPVDQEGNAAGKAEKIPAGSSFILTRTDGKSFVDAKLKDGRLIRLEVTGSYPQYINGVDANELFKELFFAG